MTIAGRPGVVSTALVGAFLGLLFALFDVLVAQRILELSSWELVALRRGEWFLSPLAYNLIVLQPIGLALGAVIGSVMALIGTSAIGVQYCRVHFAICSLVLGALVVTGRALAHTGLGTSRLSFGSLLIISGSLMLVAGAGALLSRSRFISKIYTKRVAAFLGIVVLVAGLGSWLGQDLAMQHRSSRAASSERAREKRPNVLLLVLDTLRADAVHSASGEVSDALPGIQALAREGTTFSRAFSVSAWTLPSHASMFTGLFPIQHGTGWQHQRLEPEYVTLAESFEKHGYQTVGISENPFIGRSTGFSQGISDFYEMTFYDSVQEPVGMLVATAISRGLGSTRWTGEYTRSSMRRFETWLLEQRDPSLPFFGFVNLMAAHLPNYPRSSKDSREVSNEHLSRIEPINKIPERHYLEQYRLEEPELATMRQLYAGDIRFLDTQVGELLRLLRNAELLERTVVILTADHGENFGEHGLVEHQLCLYNTLLHVPLIVRYPTAVEGGVVVDTPVSTAFIPRTLEQLLGMTLIDDRPDNDPRSLLQPGGGDLYFQYGNPVQMLREVLENEGQEFEFEQFDREINSISDGDLKLIRYSDGSEELYRLSEDMGEQEDLRSSLPEEAARLRVRLDDWLQRVQHFELPPEAPEMDEETSRALRALGYVQ